MRERFLILLTIDVSKEIVLCAYRNHITVLLCWHEPTLPRVFEDNQMKIFPARLSLQSMCYLLGSSMFAPNEPSHRRRSLSVRQSVKCWDEFEVISQPACWCLPSWTSDGISWFQQLNKVFIPMEWHSQIDLTSVKGHLRSFWANDRDDRLLFFLLRRDQRNAPWQRSVLPLITMIISHTCADPVIDKWTNVPWSDVISSLFLIW